MYFIIIKPSRTKIVGEEIYIYTNIKSNFAISILDIHRDL